MLADCPVFFLPGCPPSLEGVINVRGDIELVVRLRALLGLPEAAPGQASRIVLGQASAMRSGIRVDRVEDVVDVSKAPSRRRPTPFPNICAPSCWGSSTSTAIGSPLDWSGCSRITVPDCARMEGATR